MSEGAGSALRIAMIGQRGLPATFGGIERHVEEIGARLADDGHRVTVYCRGSYCAQRQQRYRGMRLRHLSAPDTKHLDTISASAVATADALLAGHDVLHYHALGPGLLAPLPRYLTRSRVVLTVHGLDDQRAKWGRGARAVLGTAHRMSARVPDATVVVSRDLARHYAEAFGRATVYIPNGVGEPRRRPADMITRRYGLTRGSYLLTVSRLVPEKGLDGLIRAFRQVDTDRRLVVVGDTSHSHDHVAALHRLAEADPRVLLTGYHYGDALAELYSNAAGFVLPSRLEGLPLVLLEAASYGLPMVASGIPPHREILGPGGPGGRLYEPGDENALASAMSGLLGRLGAETRGAHALGTRVRAEYSWDAAAVTLGGLYHRLADAGRLGAPRALLRGAA